MEKAPVQSQSTIFDAIAANELAASGMELAARNAAPVLVVAQQAAIELGRRNRFVTADDVQAAMMAKGYTPQDLGNAAGSMFRGRCWKWHGKTVKSERVASHGRLIRVWEYVGQ